MNKEKFSTTIWQIGIGLSLTFPSFFLGELVKSFYTTASTTAEWTQILVAGLAQWTMFILGVVVFSLGLYNLLQAIFGEPEETDLTKY